jgi:hypothetical protein
MDGGTVARVETISAGVRVTFADGYTFLFPSEFLYGIRLRDGQLIGQNIIPDGLAD